MVETRYIACRYIPARGRVSRVYRETMYRRAIVVAQVVLLASARGRATAPETPPTGWTRVTSGAGDLDVALPPWLVAFETSGAIFANEVMADGTPGLQLMAEGPQTAEPQPTDGEAIETWLAARIEAPGAGEPLAESTGLPAGDAIVIRRLDRADTATAWRVAAWAIRMPHGVAYLLIDGPLERWVGREEDVERIAGCSAHRRRLSLQQRPEPLGPRPQVSLHDPARHRDEHAAAG